MEKSDKLKKNIQQRVIRVFISSTFKDMQAEREELVKKIFPQIRKICEERRVTWGEVDLRWGITDEQKAEGKVLPICLAEIEHCRPYFIGILGERYGWIDKEIPTNVLEEYGWLKDYKDKSVTELEILHGVLRNPEMADHAFFYFRDPSYLDSVDEDEMIDYMEAPYEDEIRNYGKEKAEKLAEERRDKLLKLKNSVKESGFPFKENYSDPKDLGEQVYNDLKSVIDELYPEEEKPDPLEQRRIEHEAFALSRFNIYIQREEYFDRLNEHVESNDPPLVVIGESGSGKSALLANWAKNYSKTKDKPFILTHYVGATSDSAEWASMLRRIMGELKEHFNFQQDIPDDPEKLKSEFANWLHMAAAKERIVLIIDALNQLEDLDGALDLFWLPEYIPENIRLIVSSLPGKSLNELKKREWPTLEVKSLDIHEREKLINDYLYQYKKSLSEQMVEHVVFHSQTSNPLYLRALLEEIRLHGDHFTLPQRIDHYLEALTVEDLYAKILERYEEDYDEDRENLVKDAFSCIWVARKGLSSNELLYLLGSNEEPLPGALWSPLYLAAENSMIDKAGLLGFSHDYIKSAVHKRYLPTEDDKKSYHMLLADYFDSQILNNRKVDELPWQLDKAESWKRLKNSITDIGMFLELNSEVKRYELVKYWQDIGNQYDMVESYNNSLDNISIKSSMFFPKYYTEVARFLQLNAYYDGAEDLYLKALQKNESDAGQINPNAAQIMNNLAMLYHDKFDFENAEYFYRKSIAIKEKIYGDKHEDIALSLNNLAELLREKRELDEAEILYKKALDINEEVFGSEHPKTATSIHNLAGLLKDKGNLDEAELLLRKSLEIREKTIGENHPDVAGSLNNLGLLLRDKKKYDEAKKLCGRALKINEKVLGSKHPKTASSLNNLAVLFLDEKNFDDAESLYRKALEINKKVLGLEHPSTAANLNGLSMVLYQKRDFDSAEPLIRQTLEIYEKIYSSYHPYTLEIRSILASLEKAKKSRWKFW